MRQPIRTPEGEERERERLRARTQAAREAKALKDARKIQLMGYRAVDLNSPGALAVKEWRDDLIHTLGGDDALTPQKKALINSAALTMLAITRLDDLLLVSTGPLVDSKTFELAPFVLQREALIDGLSRRLKMLGLERAKPKSVTDLRSFGAELAKRRQSDDDESDPEIIESQAGPVDTPDDIGV